jgi:hypothetical protein
VVIATSIAPSSKVEIDLLQRALDESRLVTDDLEFEVGGTTPFNSAIRFLTPSITFTVLLPDCLRTMSVTHGWPLAVESERGSSTASSNRATSFKNTGWPAESSPR